MQIDLLLVGLFYEKIGPYINSRGLRVCDSRATDFTSTPSSIGAGTIPGEKMHLSEIEGIEGLRFTVTSGQGVQDNVGVGSFR